MSAERLAKIPEVDLDPDGVFKYVLIRVHSKTDESYVDIVRGYAWAEYHGRIHVFEWMTGVGNACGYLLTSAMCVVVNFTEMHY